MKKLEDQLLNLMLILKSVRWSASNQNYVCLRNGRILANAGYQDTKLKFAMWDLDSLGYIQVRCGFLDYLDRMNRVRHHI